MNVLSNRLRQAAMPSVPLRLGPTTARWCRLGWIAAALATVALAMVATPLVFSVYQTICPVPICDLLLPQPNATTLALLERSGIGLPAYAAIMVAVEWGLFAVWLGIGALIVWKQPADPVGLILAGTGLVVGPSSFVRVFTVVDPANTLPAQLQLFAASVSAALFFGLFPDGRWVPRCAGWVVLATVVDGIVANFIAPAWANESSLLSVILSLLLWSFLLGAQVYRYRHIATPIQRLQATWVVFGVGIFVLNIGVLVGSFALGLAERFQVLTLLLCYGANTVLALAFGVAILRYRLFAIDLIINRTLVYSVLSALVIGAYVLLVGGLGTLLQAQGSLALSLLATGAIAVAFQPLRERVQHGVDRLLYGRRAEPYAVVAQLGGRLEAAFAPDAIFPAITQTLAEALRLPYVAIGFDEQDRSQIAAATGTPIGTPIALALHYQGAIVGQLLISPRRGEAELSAADERLLNQLARQAGVAVHGVRVMAELTRLSTDLQHARERLVLAREAERYRIRRDLHDDLAPTLAGLALSADAVADLVAGNPRRAEALARELHVQIREAAGGVRRLVHDLRPPTLDEYGLVPALHERAAQLSGRDGPELSVDALTSVPPLPAAVEVAAYRIVQEALMNIVKHAHARRGSITLRHDDGLLIEVLDDGAGIAAGSVRGVGIRSMRERAEELGGTFELGAAAGGGTAVRVWLPIHAGAA